MAAVVAMQGEEPGRRRLAAKTSEDGSLKQLVCAAMSFAILAAPLSAGAAPKQKDTVKVGRFTKRAIGTVQSITDGDAGCYYELGDAKGASFTETADFELCDPKFKKRYKGRKVMLSYKIEKVMADDCEGNPECPRHKYEPVVKKVTVIK